MFVNDAKMTYDGDTYVTLPHLVERGFTARDLRFCFLQTHYRQPVHLTDDKLRAAHSSLNELDAFVATLRAASSTGPRVADVTVWLNKIKDSCTKAVFDDVNVVGAITALFGLIEQVNRLNAEHPIGRDDAQAILQTLRDLDRILAILPPEKV